MRKNTRKLKRAARKAGMPLKQFAREHELGPAWDARKREEVVYIAQDNPNRPKPRPRINPMQLRPWFEVEGGFVR